MKILIMLSNEVNESKKLELYDKIRDKTGKRRFPCSLFDYTEKSKEEIETLLSQEPYDVIILTSNSSFLTLVPRKILLSNVYFSDGESVLSLRNSTRLQIRVLEDLKKHFDDGEFKISDFRHEPESVKCPDCNGTGGEPCFDLSDSVPCALCEGRGIVKEGTTGWLRKFLLTKLED